ncbi:hypothetical protein BT69DRAFT_808708 [Atractiella rhizophila]|nr:hypothetical protein BT69DRAFT_808708 [Atractiella rhizophila]
MTEASREGYKVASEVSKASSYAKNPSYASLPSSDYKLATEAAKEGYEAANVASEGFTNWPIKRRRFHPMVKTPATPLSHQTTTSSRMLRARGTNWLTRLQAPHPALRTPAMLPSLRVTTSWRLKLRARDTNPRTLRARVTN